MNEQDRKAWEARHDACAIAVVKAHEFNKRLEQINTACAIDPPIEPIPHSTIHKLRLERDKAADVVYAHVEEAK